jgi:formyltetrahydrofolate-dependent phosphoribosylglycinamide formyltransferase
MLKRLQQKWGVSNSQFLLILCVFAITGTSTAYITKAITTWVGFTEDTSWLWRFLLRLAILMFGYQAILLLVAFLFGQFPFFWRYEKKILKRIGIKVEGVRSKAEGGNQKSQTWPPWQISNLSAVADLKPVRRGGSQMVRIAIFASGAGSNARKIIDHFKNHSSIGIALIASNKPGAGVLNIAESENIPSLIIEKERFFRGDAYVSELRERNIQWIILAGFLWKIPTSLIHAFPGKIINIHPALLPKYGGKGMYGHFVHEAVIEAKEKESGITIHYVDEQFDHGKHILQLTCPVDETDTPETLAKKVLVLEHKYYPEVIAQLITGSTRT